MFHFKASLNMIMEKPIAPSGTTNINDAALSGPSLSVALKNIVVAMLSAPIETARRLIQKIQSSFRTISRSILQTNGIENNVDRKKVQKLYTKMFKYLRAFGEMIVMKAHVNEHIRNIKFPPLISSCQFSDQILRRKHPPTNPRKRPIALKSVGAFLKMIRVIKYVNIGFVVVTSTPPAPANPIFVAVKKK